MRGIRPVVFLAVAICVALSISSRTPAPAIEDVVPVGDDLPGDGAPAASPPGLALAVDWQGPGPEGFDVIYTSLIIIDPESADGEPLMGSSEGSPATVVTYRNSMRWQNEARTRPKGELYDITYPALCWIDQRGRLHVDARRTPRHTVQGPMRGTRLNRWYPDSFFDRTRQRGEYQRHLPEHPPTTGRLALSTTVGTPEYQRLRALAQSLVRNTW